MQFEVNERNRFVGEQQTRGDEEHRTADVPALESWGHEAPEEHRAADGDDGEQVQSVFHRDTSSKSTAS